MLTLRIRQDAGSAPGSYRVQVELDDDGLVQAAECAMAFELNQDDSRELRWYLEDYLEYPVDPAPQIADRVESRMAELGCAVFNAVFPAGSETRDLWSLVRDRVSEARVEVITDVTRATTVPWELLRDPRTDTPIALRARSFVRSYRQAAQRPRLPRDTNSEIRILLVICRPGGRDDVPFRSVASQLVRLHPAAEHAFRLKVLRPATFAALGRELRRAADGRKPYHVVHFDGHGTYADLGGYSGGGGGTGRPSPLRYHVRAGAHGYLLFEDADTEDNIEYVDGIRLGSLLAETEVPILVLNACRSAHSDVAADPAEADAEMAATAAARAELTPVGDAHARIRAYGSLAQEIVDAGVAGVVAMRYNVYVDTATRFVGEMYENLLAGQELGQAVTRGRKNLADDPVREIAFDRLPLQDWPVPVVYEAAPLQLFPPSDRSLSLGEPDSAGNRPEGLPPAPDIGFYGRDETLLALDRALDSNQIVLLHAFAGSGKTTTVAEFARWYQLTGGLDESGLGSGPVVFSSFELHRPLSAVLNDLWDAVSNRLPPDAVGRWMGLSAAERRTVALELLRKLPVLWIWDNVEPIRGFPAGAESAWSATEVAELADFLRDLRATQAKVVLTSRRPEDELLGDLPTRILLPPMAMPERLQLARAAAARSGHRLTDVADWRPLLRFTDGNPLTVTVLVREALRSGVRTQADVERFVSQVRAGESDLDDDEDLGRSRSLGASLSYGLAVAFTERERAVLALLHLFQRTVSATALQQVKSLLQSTETARMQTALALATDDDVHRVLSQAAEIGLLSPIGGGSFLIHPALPWYFQRLFTETFGPLTGPDGQAAARAYVDTFALIADVYYQAQLAGKQNVILLATVNEANFLHARDLAIRYQWWDRVMEPMRGLQILYEHAGRDLELARLTEELVPYLTEASTGLPRPDLEPDFLVLIEFLTRVARRARNWELAEQLLRSSLQVSERRAEAARATPAASRDLNRIRSLGVDYNHLGIVLESQHKPECVEYFEKALAIFGEIEDSPLIARTAGNLANVYLLTPARRNLDLSEKWLLKAIQHYRDDLLGRTKCLGQLAQVKYLQLINSLADGTDSGISKRIWREAAELLNEVFRLIPDEAIRELSVIHELAARLYVVVGEIDRAMSHCQQAIRMDEQLGQPFLAGATRIYTAEILAQAGRFEDAALFAERAIEDFQRVGALDRITAAQRLLDKIRAGRRGE